LRKKDGYIDRGPAGRPIEQQGILHRPDGTTRELPVHGLKISRVRFLPFANKYQLNHPICHGASSALKAKAGCDPLLLMTPEGEIESIPFPDELRDHLKQFDFTYAVKGGVLIRVVYPGKQGYYLWRNNVLYELWRSRETGFMNLLPAEFWGGEALSPDGCKVAFFRANSTNARSVKQIYIFDHCGIGR
jgi:hypothetical protein